MEIRVSNLLQNYKLTMTNTSPFLSVFLSNAKQLQYIALCSHISLYIYIYRTSNFISLLQQDLHASVLKLHNKISYIGIFQPLLFKCFEAVSLLLLFFANQVIKKIYIPVDQDENNVSFKHKKIFQITFMKCTIHFTFQFNKAFLFSDLYLFQYILLFKPFILKILVTIYDNYMQYTA